jgi:DNA-binding CsgD family transcriptional regulator
MGDLDWGTNFCVFYETKKDLLEMNSAFMEAGLLRNESCIWAASNPTTVAEAEGFLRNNIAGFERYRAAGQLEILPGDAWRLWDDDCDAPRIIGEWHGKLEHALSSGFRGLRVSLNALWLQEHRWKEFSECERKLSQSVAGQKMIAMCAYPLGASQATDLLEGIRTHDFTIAKHDGGWDLLRNAAMRSTGGETKQLRGSTRMLSRPFPGHKLLTPREHVVLAQIVRGASSKEAGRALGVSHRTVEFHRQNIMRKLGVVNIAELLFTVLGDSE